MLSPDDAVLRVRNQAGAVVETGNVGRHNGCQARITYGNVSNHQRCAFVVDVGQQFIAQRRVLNAATDHAKTDKCRENHAGSHGYPGRGRPSQGRSCTLRQRSNIIGHGRR